MANHEQNNGGPAETSRPGGLGRLGDVAVGGLVEAEEATRRVLGLFRRDLEERQHALSGETTARTTGLRRRLTELADRGSAERIRGRAWVAAGMDTMVTAVASAPALSRVVDAQLDRVLRPLVDVVLGEVLELLERDPERIRALVRSQRASMVDELVGRVRSGAAAGDSNVDRLTARVLHQSPAPVPPGETR